MSRRAVIKGTGALVLCFSLLPDAWPEPRLPGSLAKNPLLDAWIRVDADGRITAFTGKVELGQGIKTALLQVVAEELEVPFEQVSLVTADTGRTVDEGYTAGSHSVQDSGTALRNAAAQVREILIGEAARRLKVAPEQLRAKRRRHRSQRGPHHLRRVGVRQLVACRRAGCFETEGPQPVQGHGPLGTACRYSCEGNRRSCVRA